MKRISELITPEKARELLKTDSKPVDPAKVERLKNKMLSGNWKIDNGYFVTIKNGKILNGHHRLTAVAESGLTLIMRIQYEEN